jgi:hypothetical protein
VDAIRVATFAQPQQVLAQVARREVLNALDRSTFEVGLPEVQLFAVELDGSGTQPTGLPVDDKALDVPRQLGL